MIRPIALTLLSMLLGTGLGIVVGIAPASGDTTYYPAQTNGVRIYLSRACHDPDLGPDCVTNQGCDGYDENTRSNGMAKDFKDELLARQYPVRIGNGGPLANVSSSNSWNADIHVPIHSNAYGSAPCPGGQANTFGTKPQYRNARAEQLAVLMRDWVGAGSPGTEDIKIQNTGNYENNAPNATPVYLETEYHIWQQGVDWLRNSSNWAWRVGTAIDRCHGFPRQGMGDTATAECSWG